MSIYSTCFWESEALLLIVANVDFSNIFFSIMVIASVWEVIRYDDPIEKFLLKSEALRHCLNGSVTILVICKSKLVLAASLNMVLAAEQLLDTVEEI